jgi:hypothetical protein
MKEFNRFLLIQKTERSDSILHDFAVRCSIFCGSLFSPAAGCQSGQFNHQETMPFWHNFFTRCQDGGARELNSDT